MGDAAATNGRKMLPGRPREFSRTSERQLAPVVALSRYRSTSNESMIRTTLSLCLTAALAQFAAPEAIAQSRRDEIRMGKWSKNEIPRGWVVHETRHYQVQSQAGKDKAKRLGRHMEQMVKLYKKTFPPGKDGFIKRPIKLFKDHKSYLEYSAAGAGAAAYYIWSPNREMVCYDTGKWQDKPGESDGPTTGGKRSRKDIYDRLLRRSKMDLLGVMSHEGWHQYFHWYVVSRSAGLPSWINEGMGDYFYCAVPPYSDKGKPKGKVELGRLNPTRLPIIRAAVKQDRHVPLRKIIHYTQREYYSNPGVCYAEGWAMCHFMLHHKKKKIRKIIPKFIKLVRDDSNIKNVTKKAFRGIDLDELEEEWKAWILSTKLPSEIEAEKELKKLEEEEKKKLGDGAVDIGALDEATIERMKEAARKAGVELDDEMIERMRKAAKEAAKKAGGDGDTGKGPE